ncbi:bifunctional 5,10-methylenetetrahydrofolate dehydrogenase/5,10-methenyltetrahydrofolate cyclohydrolase [Alkalibacterium sp. MB6]|uniref:bifunctional 5,10-methylenetetrahydrofolate dehydrogenase/5,10-methenyltetrahydrofolate cyclohydrolase n=1 Tax=Alkalibacterium sp. MB6 TaxID=2081965 RepID=UPI0013798A53|nr:bifunctional 5,10-methylenetetrahydrofolate dehydrogenase/5,10-methenyltetrahydrofolate cyclohydrolase [Alkalibacterium sp. MB6]
MAKVLKGKPVAQDIIKGTQQTVEDLNKINVFPKLTIVRVGDDPSSISYETAAIKTMNQVGIEVESVVFDSNVEVETVIQAIEELNRDYAVHGILVMQPLPASIDRNDIARHIQPTKDIDGLTPMNLGRVVENDPTTLEPSTPRAVMALLAYYNIGIEGKDICVIGSSPVVGKPLTVMLLNAEATVTNLHIKSKDVKKYTKEADIIISATGATELVTADYIKEGAVVIDVGFGYKDGKPVGDVKYDEVSKKASAITPVPGGVGSITTAILAEQVTQAAWMMRSDEDSGH